MIYITMSKTDKTNTSKEVLFDELHTLLTTLKQEILNSQYKNKSLSKYIDNYKSSQDESRKTELTDAIIHVMTNMQISQNLRNQITKMQNRTKSTQSLLDDFHYVIHTIFNTINLKELNDNNIKSIIENAEIKNYEVTKEESGNKDTAALEKTILRNWSKEQLTDTINHTHHIDLLLIMSQNIIIGYVDNHQIPMIIPWFLNKILLLYHSNTQKLQTLCKYITNEKELTNQSYEPLPDNFENTKDEFEKSNIDEFVELSINEEFGKIKKLFDDIADHVLKIKLTDKGTTNNLSHYINECITNKNEISLYTAVSSIINNIEIPKEIKDQIDSINEKISPEVQLMVIEHLQKNIFNKMDINKLNDDNIRKIITINKYNQILSDAQSEDNLIKILKQNDTDIFFITLNIILKKYNNKIINDLLWEYAKKSQQQTIDLKTKKILEKHNNLIKQFFLDFKQNIIESKYNNEPLSKYINEFNKENNPTSEELLTKAVNDILKNYKINQELTKQIKAITSQSKDMNEIIEYLDSDIFNNTNLKNFNDTNIDSLIESAIPTANSNIKTNIKSQIPNNMDILYLMLLNIFPKYTNTILQSIFTEYTQKLQSNNSSLKTPTGTPIIKQTDTSSQGGTTTPINPLTHLGDTPINPLTHLGDIPDGPTHQPSTDQPNPTEEQLQLAAELKKQQDADELKKQQEEARKAKEDAEAQKLKEQQDAEAQKLKEELKEQQEAERKAQADKLKKQQKDQSDKSISIFIWIPILACFSGGLSFLGYTLYLVFTEEDIHNAYLHQQYTESGII